MFVDFECENLKKAIIKNYKEKIDPNFDGVEVTPEMMEKFDLLDLNESDISSLKGIEYAKNLRHLYMAFNSINNIEPLKACQNLEKLDFHGNDVVDIWPLEGLRRLEFLNIANNRITDVMALNDIANIDAINIKGNTIENQLPLRHIRFVKNKEKNFNMSNISIFDLDKGVSLGLIKNEKFKSNLISIYFARNLKREEATKVSLLSNMLSVGTMKYPTMRDISRRLDELYGMSMNVGVSKHGEKALTYFKFLSVSDKYLDEPIFEEVVDFINEIVSNPLVIDKKLNPDMFDIEKEILKDEINSKINDKRSYASLRCIEAMCYDEPYSIDQVGYVEDLKSITAENMYEMYKEFIATSRIFITVEGDFDEEEAHKICHDKFKFDRGNIENIERERFDIVPHDPTYLTEIIGANQGKLVIGYRTGVDYKDYENYYSLMVGNSLFGGGPHSKLFNNVREKESICYYASSVLEKCKGLMIVSSGIEVNNYERALELITKELQDVINGNFSEEDVDNSKKSILNALKASYDSVSGESDFTYNQFISGTNLEIEEVINYVSNVDKESIVRSMANIFEDTVYYLR